jgi:predicted DNA-binding protein (MmcQ/YjbR family)
MGYASTANMEILQKLIVLPRPTSLHSIQPPLAPAFHMKERGKWITAAVVKEVEKYKKPMAHPSYICT